MRKALIGAAAWLGAVAAPAAAQEAARPVELMILGTYHMGNPGRDIVNMAADDVTSSRRQAEIEAVVAALAEWRPDRILIEWQRPAPFTVAEYRAFAPDELRTNRNEVVQIGFRLARRLGHQDVFGFDEQPGEGEPDYFQFGRVQRWAEANARQAAVEQALDYFRETVAADGAAQADHNIAELLLRQNDPERDRAAQARGHYAFLAFGDADDQVGAEFNAYWYMRNAKMFAKIGLISRPGERVLVLVGSGHRYWLNHFAETAPGFSPVDPSPFLRRAAAAIPSP